MTSKDTWIENLTAQNDALKAERDQALVGEAYANGFGLAAVNAWEARALKAEAELASLRTEQERLQSERDEIRELFRQQLTRREAADAEQERLKEALKALTASWRRNDFYAIGQNKLCADELDAALTLTPRQP